MPVELRPVRELALRVPSPIEELADDRLTARGIRLFLKRDDLINPEIPGNKWRKLKYNLVAAAEQGQQVLLTFGGAYSNHIRATAAAGYYFGFSTIGVIRGEEHLPLNPALAYAVDRGMQLIYLDRTTYRDKDNPAVTDRLHQRFGEFYLLPEGGTNVHALRGCAELPAEIPIEFDLICCATATGGTLAGIATALKPGQHALGFSVLKGGTFLDEEVRRLQHVCGHVTENWSIEIEFHFGGYAKRKPDLDRFIDDFQQRHGVTLDWVYEAKMMYGIFKLLELDRFHPGTVVVAVVA